METDAHVATQSGCLNRILFAGARSGELRNSEPAARQARVGVANSADAGGALQETAVGEAVSLFPFSFGLTGECVCARARVSQCFQRMCMTSK